MLVYEVETNPSKQLTGQQLCVESITASAMPDKECSNMNSTTTRQMIVAAATGALALGAIFMAGNNAVNAQNRDDTNRTAPRVATYDPQSAFEEYHEAARLESRLQQIQAQMQQAQQEGDQQRMIQLQQQMQAEQNQVVEKFYQDVEQSAPDVAKENRVDVLAVDIVYTADRVDDPEDLTDEIVVAINRDAEAGRGEHPTQP